MATMRPSFTATSPAKRGALVPSITVPPRTIRSTSLSFIRVSSTEMAGHQLLAVATRAERRLLLGADRLRERAARVEAATRGRVGGAGRIALQQDALRRRPRI